MFIIPNCLKTLLICLILVLVHIAPCSSPQLLSKKKEKNFELCCSFPCQHGGVCIERKFSYTCDCQNTGFHGKNCAIETWMKFLRCQLNNMLEIIISIYYAFCSFFSAHSLYFPSYNKMVADSFSQMHIVGMYGLNGESYMTLNPLYNGYGAIRLAPAVPQFCPTPLGTKGKMKFYPVNEVYNNLLNRQKFHRSKSVNLLFTIYGLHFFLQFLDHGNFHGVTCSHIYAEHGRSFTKGKLLTEMFNGEEYPLCQQTIHKKTFTHYLGKSEQADWKMSLIKQNSLIYAMATIWLREHNRVCDILAKIWPSWDDDRLFDTARNIITGEVLVITLSEWYPALMGYKANLFYDPSYLHSGYGLIQNKLPIETYLTLHWPNLIPDRLTINNHTIYFTESFWYNLDRNLVKRFGLYDVVKAFTLNPSGQNGIHNAANSLAQTTKYVIEMGRKLRIPSFNRMRILLGLKPYNTFSQIVKDEKYVPNLKKIFENVEGIEFIPGMLIESNPCQRNALGETAMTLIGPWLFKAILSHPLGSKSMWKPSTMGGKVGWDIVNNAKLKNLVCQNVKSSDMCFKYQIHFRFKSEKRKRVSIKKCKKQKKKYRCGKKLY